MISCVTGDICKEVIEDPALDEMWEAAKLDKGYQSVAMTVKMKMDEEMYKSLSKAAIKENVGLGIERISVIEKGKTMILLMDHTGIVVPPPMRKKVMDREHMAHPGVTKMQNSLRAKYFWPGIVGAVKRAVEGCEACQLHMRSQTRDPHRPALEYVSRPMQAVGIDFFQRGGHKYLLLMDHFSGMPLYKKMTLSTGTEHTIRQHKRWFATFGLVRSIRCDNGSPFQEREFKEFCDEYKIKLDLTSPYNPETSGAAERGVGLIKMIMKKTETEGSDREEALAVFRNTRNESWYSPNQLFFLRNWRDAKLPDLRAEPVLEEMVTARKRVNGGCYKVKEDELKAAMAGPEPRRHGEGTAPQN